MKKAAFSVQGGAGGDSHLSELCGPSTPLGVGDYIGAKGSAWLRDGVHRTDSIVLVRAVAVWGALSSVAFGESSHAPSLRQTQGMALKWHGSVKRRPRAFRLWCCGRGDTASAPHARSTACKCTGVGRVAKARLAPSPASGHGFRCSKAWWQKSTGCVITNLQVAIG